MRLTIYLLAFCVGIVLFSCRETRKAANPNNDATHKVPSGEDSAYKDAIAIHDEVMPRMGKLIGYQKKARQRLDSLEEFMMRVRLIPSAAKSYMEKKDSLSKLVFDLNLSEKEMNDWMEQFNPDPKLASAQERTAYFQDQKQKAQKMRDGFFASLSRAKNMLGD